MRRSCALARTQPSWLVTGSGSASAASAPGKRKAISSGPRLLAILASARVVSPGDAAPIGGEAHGPACAGLCLSIPLWSRRSWGPNLDIDRLNAAGRHEAAIGREGARKHDIAVLR